MNFTHRCVDPLEWDPARTYTHREWYKPSGLWLSVDGDWERWLADEGIEWGGEHTYSFDVDVDRCLHLATVDELDRFHDTYVVPNCPLFYGKTDAYRLNWNPLAKQHAGIIIAPYLWERRMQGPASSWYYPWDCASACVWDLTAVDTPVAVQS